MLGLVLLGLLCMAVLWVCWGGWLLLREDLDDADGETQYMRRFSEPWGPTEGPLYFVSVSYYG